jgi:hypothetical protein
MMESRPWFSDSSHNITWEWEEYIISGPAPNLLNCNLHLARPLEAVCTSESQECFFR